MYINVCVYSHTVLGGMKITHTLCIYSLVGTVLWVYIQCIVVYM